MGKMWKNSCKKLLKSTLKKCVRKSGKVEKGGFKQDFPKVLKVVLNRNSYLLNWEVLHNSTEPTITTKIYN